MKKHIFIIEIVAIVLLIGLLIYLIFMAVLNTDKSKISRANRIYGTEICSGNCVMTADVVVLKCPICLKNFNGSSCQSICRECSKITNRCVVCGKLYSN